MRSDIDWEEFDRHCDFTPYKEYVKNAADNKGNYKNAPYGTYEVKLTKLELTLTKATKKPMLVAWLKIVNDCKYTSQMIFANFVLNIESGFTIHKANEFLKALVKDTNEGEKAFDIEFYNTKQYAQLIDDIWECIDGRYEYAIRYFDNKGWPSYSVEETFDVEDEEG